MAEYIERERIRKALVGACLMSQNCPMFIAAKIDQMIDCEPAADVAPVVHGHWVDECKCSACGEMSYEEAKSDETDPNCYYVLSDYCPNCGAKMDEEEHNG